MSSAPDAPVGRPNIFAPVFDELREQDGFRARRARVGYQLQMERIGVSVWEVAPHQTAYPYHCHLAEEEAAIVLEGAPRLRTPDGERRLERGEVVRFPIGPAGAHQLINDSDEPVRFVSLSTNGAPDIVLYPDAGKVGPAERNPDGSGLKLFFRIEDGVDYYDGETPQPA